MHVHTETLINTQNKSKQLKEIPPLKNVYSLGKVVLHILIIFSL